MRDDDELLPDDTGSDTRVRRQGDRDTQTGDGRSRRTPPPVKPGEIYGDFQLEKLLGQGSSSCVFRALDTVSRRTCALKILTATKQNDLRRNRIGFRRMMGLRHPNLMRVDQMHQFGDFLALSMEEIQGKTLSQSRRRFRKVEPHIAYNKLLSLTRDFAAGLAAIHGHGLLHRDIKPSNLMVDRNDRGLIIDYGLVGTFDAELAYKCFRDYIAGTPRYISPEAYFEQRYTPAGDIFSLGLSIVETLKSIGGLAEWTRSKETRDQDAIKISSAVKTIGNEVPEILREACMEMLQIHPGDRPTAMQLSRLGMPVGRTTIYMGGQQLFGREDDFKDICDWLSEIYGGKQGRLHIHGGSGIGKTALVDAIDRHLRSLNWGQVFRARCHPRENEPLQTFKQIADEIANRYASTDREPMQLDPVSTAILHAALPVLQDAVQASVRLSPDSNLKRQRIDAIQAAINLTVEMRKMGPLVLIIDDVHWSDSDTNMILDALQTCGGGMLGIVTISRFKKSLQQQPPQKVVNITPLNDETSCQILADAAARWSVNITPAALQELAETACGNPFRLSELTDEFRPNGLLHSIPTPTDSSLSNLGNLDRLWQHRVNRLSTEARRLLPIIVTAGYPVSINQLAVLSRPDANVEIAVSELVRQRLVTDDATGGCCIHMIHDRVSAGITDQLDPADRVTANEAWAELLLADTGTDKHAARIARHLRDAGKPAESIEFANLAAQQAEHAFAYAEAADWHLSVADTIESQSQTLHHLIEAARCYALAGQPAKAAKVHTRLSETTDGNEQLHHRISACLLSIRSGRYDDTRNELVQLIDQLGLSRDDANDDTPAFTGPTNCDVPNDTAPTAASLPATATENTQLRFAGNLVRPLILHDASLARALFATTAKLSGTIGNTGHRYNTAIGSAVYLCCDDGPERAVGEALLRDLQAGATDLGGKTEGDFWTAKTLTNTLKMNWAATPSLISNGLKAYAMHEKDSARFEQANLRWLATFTDWYCGNWTELTQTSNKLVDEGRLHNDLLCEFIATTGFAATSHLGRLGNAAQTAPAEQMSPTLPIETQNQAIFPGRDQPKADDALQLADWLNFIARCLSANYHGDTSTAVALATSFAAQMRDSELANIQLVRVVTNQIVALTLLHVNAQKDFRRWPPNQTHPSVQTAAAQAIVNLRSEKLAFPIMLSELYGGILAGQNGETTSSRQRLVAAQQLAIEQGLQPFQLAAEDALANLQDNAAVNLLRHRMQNRGIHNPERFERIYTAAIEQR